MAGYDGLGLNPRKALRLTDIHPYGLNPDGTPIAFKKLVSKITKEVEDETSKESTQVKSEG
jgi:hypothetical protein